MKMEKRVLQVSVENVAGGGAAVATTSENAAVIKSSGLQRSFSCRMLGFQLLWKNRFFNQIEGK
jgi:hypothetical protein